MGKSIISVLNAAHPFKQSAPAAPAAPPPPQAPPPPPPPTESSAPLIGESPVVDAEAAGVRGAKRRKAATRAKSLLALDDSSKPSILGS